MRFEFLSIHGVYTKAYKLNRDAKVFKELKVFLERGNMIKFNSNNGYYGSHYNGCNTFIF